MESLPTQSTHTRLVSSHILPPGDEEEDVVVEQTLRPADLTEFVGQHHIKEPVLIAIEASKTRGDAFEHTLLHGNPGLGKTTLAHIIAKEMASTIRVTSGPALDRVGDLAAILSQLEHGDVLFIDEIHRMNKTIEEVLYSAMEDFALDIIVGKGPTARTLRMPLNPFTLIGATTQMNLLSSPLRDRFGHVFHFRFYDHEDIDLIVKRNARRLKVTLHDEASAMIAERSRRTPRVANRLLRRVRDYATVRHDGIIDVRATMGAFHLLHVDEYGLDDVDRHILDTIITTFQGGPVGLSTLAAATGEQTDTIETIYEPYLIQIGMLERTPRGRKATQAAVDHLSLRSHQ
ncbi:MAG: Holliday junction branch migration DNA helicase RuvB [Candidatus Magasanikbacteria bacterium]|nr:Holliday junction branch migration DNA helicase RuvB [Candidatus Magasanikbacteria bacterium]NCS72162.1 Holliday junction branch migration DNA helicase RuvB [Candidatus Magasanikbacteria bacterium]